MLVDLVNDPLAVGHALAIVVQRGIAPDVGLTWTYRGTHPPVELYDVQADVEYHAVAAVDRYGCLNVTIDDQPVTGKVPVYYLPWGEHQVYKVRLGSLRNPQPRLFFTDNLNGCAVIAEGITFMPNVYHANAMNELPSYSPVGDPSVIEAIALRVIDQRNDVMFKACQAYPTDTSRSFLQSGLRWPLVKPAGAVTPREYAVLIGRPSEDQEKAAAVTNPRIVPRAKGGLFSKSPQPVTPKFLGSRGAVFGVADTDGNWRFFVQKVVTIRGGDLVLRCAEFWPGGGAPSALFNALPEGPVTNHRRKAMLEGVES